MRASLTTLLTLATTLLVCCLCWADDIQGERTVQPGKLIKLNSATSPQVKDGKVSTRYSWRLTATDSGGKVIELDVWKHQQYLVTTAPAGSRIKVDLTVVDFDNKIFEESSAVITVEGKGPAPEPTPGPGPDPTPTPDEGATIDGKGNRVLILLESQDQSKLTAKQLIAVYGKDVRNFLNNTCTKDEENPDGAYRIWDKDVDASEAPASWRKAVKRGNEKIRQWKPSDKQTVKSALPWVMISNGKAGYEGPLPEDSEKFIALMRKYFPSTNKN